jgi:quercetin dioxygenase-like cupin family protein
MNIAKSRLAWVSACAAATGALVTGLIAVQAEATTSTVKSTQLVQATVLPTTLWGHGKTAAGDRWGVLLATYGKSDGYVVDNQFAPDQTTGWHSHLGPSVIFVVSGTVTNYESSAPDCAGRRYSAGTSFTDPGGTDVHMLRNETGLPAETIAVQFIPSGQPRRIDSPNEPANCHV